MYKKRFVLLIIEGTFDFYNFDLRGHFGGQIGQLNFLKHVTSISVHPTTNMYK